VWETRSSVRLLLVKLYKRNPGELRKNPGMTIEGRLAQLKVATGVLIFPELGGKRGIDAMNLAFDPTFQGGPGVRPGGGPRRHVTSGLRL
jgi:hypothetical protein